MSLWVRLFGLPAEDVADGDRPGWRRVAARVTTGSACVLVLFALISPNDFNRLTPAAFIRIPLEGLLAVVLVLVLPPRARRVVVAVLGALLGLLTILKLFDMGFIAVLYRPFDPVLDWAFVEAGVDYLAVMIGQFGATASVIGAVLLVIAVLVLMTLAALRLARVVDRHRVGATRSVAVLGIVWVSCAVKLPLVL